MSKVREPRPALAWPCLERLAHKGDWPRVQALRLWRDLMMPESLFNGITEDEDEDDQPSGLEVRPTETELFRAIGWNVTGRARWAHTGKRVNTYEPSDSKPALVPEAPPEAAYISLGELRFRGSVMVEWGRTAAGKPLRPVERATGVGHAAQRSEATIRAYLDLKPTAPALWKTEPLPRVECSAAGAGGNGGYYDPLPREKPTKKSHGRFGAAEARALLQSLGVDGSVPFEELPGKPCRVGKAGVVTGNQWGGVMKPKAGSGSLDETWSAGRQERDLTRIQTAISMRAAMGDYAAILDAAITDATAEQIGLSRGYTKWSAQKYGAAIIDRALDELITVADLQHNRITANDNNRIAEKIAA